MANLPPQRPPTPNDIERISFMMQQIREVLKDATFEQQISALQSLYVERMLQRALADREHFDKLKNTICREALKLLHMAKAANPEEMCALALADVDVVIIDDDEKKGTH